MAGGIAASDRALRWYAAFCAVVFVLVGGSGWVPDWYRWTGGEREVFGLCVMSATDDFTHGVTALVCLGGALHSGDSCGACSVTFGSYYALDALSYLLYGLVDGTTPVANVMLNLPHVIVGTWMLTFAYSRPQAERVAALGGLAAA